ncbi:nucleotidyl transferase AbiEii/AbiGii toxin family protein [archaeon]|nr:nucleotidyl transferase AbiEii/AbiGii toxin family protein [archaeon]
MFYERVFSELNKEGVRYVVIGGIALNLHGVPRATADLDLAVEIEEKNLEKIAAALKRIGFVPRLPVEFKDFSNLGTLEKWRREKKMLAFTFWNPKKSFEEIDILIDSPVDFEEIDKAKEVIKAKNISIPLVSLDHLIKLKEKSGRAQDEADIKSLEKIKNMR